MAGNYWQGGQGYGAGVSSLLYENGAKGGAKRHNNQNFEYGHGRKNPNIAKRKKKWSLLTAYYVWLLFW